jgi:hypothetical protein
MIGAKIYEIRVCGRLPETWLDVFADMQIEVIEEASGLVTILRGCLPDQAALHGMLQNLYGLGLGLVKVSVVEDN